MKAVCFTGHREVNVTQELKIKMFDEMEQLVKNGATDFYAGGAIGFDMLAEKAVVALRKKYPQVKLHLVLPCPEEQQTLKWSEAEKEEYKKYLSLADTIEVCSSFYHRDCMRIRNQRLVELSDICICYYNENHSASGTGQTVRLAQKKGIPIINVFIA